MKQTISIETVSKKEIIDYFQTAENRNELHRVTGFDFQNPGAAFIASGSFTARKIAEGLQQIGAQLPALVFVAIKDRATAENDYTGPGIYTYFVDENGAEGLKISCYNHDNCGALNLEYRYRKSDAEALRKYTGKKYLAVAVPGFVFNTGRNYTKANDLDRFTLSESGAVFTRNGYQHETASSTRGYYGFAYNSRGYSLDFDKSGYFLNSRRNDLQQRAKHLRYERQQNQVKTADFSKQISAARAALLELKNQAARALYAADITETALDPFEKAFGSWSGVAYVARMLERFTKKATEKTFSNMDQAQKDYQEIITKCAELSATLNS